MRYQPINSANFEIRLLEDTTNKDKKYLHFRLRHFTLSDAPPFSAISYVWGDPDDKTSQVIVDNHNFSTTKNLHDIISCQISFMRSGVGPFQTICRYFWVDAICINQDDQKERSEQILLMRYIYESSFVVIYLEEKADDVDRAAAYLIRDMTSKNAEEQSMPLSSADWSILHHFFSNAWFDRMWVIQEYVLPRRPMITVGMRPLSQSVFGAAYQIASQALIPLPLKEKVELLHGARQYCLLEETKADYEHKEALNLSLMTRLLWRFRDRRTADPRDKVYSLLPLLRKPGSYTKEGRFVPPTEDTNSLKIFDIIIDYQAPLNMVYASLVKAIVTETKSLNLICACQGASSFPQSWVPDWSIPWSHQSLLVGRMHFFEGEINRNSRYTETRKASAHMPPRVSFSADLQELAAGGIIWDSLALIGNHSAPKLDLNGIRWAFELFDQLSQPLYKAILSCYNLPNDMDQIILEFANGLLAHYYSIDECRGLDYRFFQPGASCEWLELARTFGSTDPGSSTNDRYRDVRALQVRDGRRAFVGKGGYFGLCPQEAELGDLLCILFGCDVPVVLRPTGGYYVFIGECFTHHLMQGEAIEIFERTQLESTVFNIR